MNMPHIDRDRAIPFDGISGPRMDALRNDRPSWEDYNAQRLRFAAACLAFLIVLAALAVDLGLQWVYGAGVGQ